MPLIALDILENKLKELLLVVSHLKGENTSLKDKVSLLEEKLASQKSAAPALSPAAKEVPGEVMYELSNLKETLSKYKNERKDLYLRVASIVKRLDEVIESNPTKDVPKKGDF